MAKKSNRCLLKTTAIFLNFVVKTSQIWLVLVGFFCVFSQSETICNLLSCYKINTRITGELYSFISQSELSNFFVYIITQLTFLKYFKCSRFPGCAVKCKTGFLCVLYELIAHDVKHALQNKWRYHQFVLIVRTLY